MSATFNWRLNCLIRISISTEMSVIESLRSRILIKKSFFFHFSFENI